MAVYTDVPPRASLVIDGAAVEASETVVLPLGAHELTVSRDGRTVAAPAGLATTDSFMSPTRLSVQRCRGVRWPLP